MEIDPNGSLQEMIESGEIVLCPICMLRMLMRGNLSADSTGGMAGMMQDLAFAIPGVDEAMGFAEIMKCVEGPP